jgi:hypothetical protein
MEAASVINFMWAVEVTARLEADEGAGFDCLTFIEEQGVTARPSSCRHGDCHPEVSF